MLLKLLKFQETSFKSKENYCASKVVISSASLDLQKRYANLLQTDVL